MPNSAGVEVARISVKVSPDTRQFRKDLKSDLEAIEKSLKVSIEVEPAMAGFRSKVNAATKGMKTSVKVNADVDKGSFTKIGDSLSGLKKLIPSFGTGMNPAAIALTAAAALFVLAPVIGIITTALLALPGLLSLVLAPIAAITLGLDGFKNAAKTIEPQFNQLKQTMSEAAETSFTPVMKNLAATIFPALERTLPSVTQGLADISQGVINAFNRPENAVKFEGSIKRIGTALSNMSPGFDGFTSGIIGLIDQFSLKLPAITEWFNNAGTGFDAWVQKISADGSLSTAFDNLGGIIQTVLDLIGQLGKDGLDFMGDPTKIKAFGDTLKGVADSLASIARLSGTVNDFLSGEVFSPQEPKAGDEDAFGAGGVQYYDKNTGELVKTQEQIEAVEAASANAKAGLEQMFQVPTTQGPIAAEAIQSPLDALKEVAGGKPGEPAPAPVAPIPPPDTAAAEAKVAEYQSFVDTVTAQVQGSLSAATTGESLPAPNFDAFKAAWSELPSFITTQVEAMKAAATGSLDGVVQAFVTVGGQILTEVSGWSGRISGALASLGGIGSAAGNALGAGLLAGMRSGGEAAIAYASKLAGRIAAVKGPISLDKVILEPAGEALMFGLNKGMETGFQPVLEQAKGMAGQIAEAFANGQDPTAIIAGYSDADIKRVEKVLALESKRLETQAKALDYQSKMSGNDALKARADELRMQKDQISLQKDMLGLTEDYSDAAGDVVGGDDPFVKAASGLMNAPVDFAKATGKQFMSDIGIGGDGLISKAITEGISYVFNIGSVDEAMGIKDREESKKALAVTGR